MICHYWYFKDIGYKYEPHVCNKCHDLQMAVYDLKNFLISSFIFVVRFFYFFYEYKIELLLVQ